MIGVGINTKIGPSSKSARSGWAQLYYVLRSGATWYRREVNNAGGYFKLWYSSDSGANYEELMNLDLTEESDIIDLTHIYRHRIVGTEYRVDTTLTPLGYLGAENTDWENLFST